ncbi:hypothetical protein THIARS_40344 [Thiomonas delicata]|uniref:Uncharacterized protein n=1 Tax=Thiomonas delicata TaxID=364030 RepID=A0A238D0F5_THIDL|nr:hypothetical protein THIARS_40344 [Thiomonas delicata]
MRCFAQFCAAERQKIQSLLLEPGFVRPDLATPLRATRPILSALPQHAARITTRGSLSC